MILLVACGNILRRDDGAGLVLAERLSGRLRRPGLEILRCHQLTVELAWSLAAPDVEAVLFADAALNDQSASVTPPLLRRLSDGPAALPFGHSLGPSAVVALSASLYGRRPEAWQVLIPGADFGYGEGLSPMARASLAQAEAEVLTFLADGEKGPRGPFRVPASASAATGGGR